MVLSCFHFSIYHFNFFFTINFLSAFLIRCFYGTLYKFQLIFAGRFAILNLLIVDVIVQLNFDFLCVQMSLGNEENESY